MKRAAPSALLAAVLLAIPLTCPADTGIVVPGLEGWNPFAQRAAVQPQCRTDVMPGPSGHGMLMITGGGNPIEYGGWVRIDKGIKAGAYYGLTALYRAESVADPRRQVVARLDWLDANGARAGQPDYAYETSDAGAWTRLTLGVPAPKGAAAVRIELILGWAPSGRVWWDKVSLAEAPPPPPRWVRLGTVCLHPRNNPDNIGAFIAELDKIAADKPDIVCLGEEILDEGSSKSYQEAAEPIPGPSTARLGEAARRHSMYIVAGLTERDGPAVYNTTVLIDRKGEVVGKYRKVYLPREEIEGGLTPGDTLPVFDTDFGRIGIMVCWDAEYADPARALAMRGAEVILVPAAGGYMTLLKARALENHLYVVSSGETVESSIIDPTGTVLFETMQSGTDKVIAVDLNARVTDDWLGDMRARFHKELRPGLDVPPPPQSP